MSRGRTRLKRAALRAQAARNDGAPMKTPREFPGFRMRRERPRRLQEGRWGYILAWAIGVPVPILIVIYLLRGCT